MTSYCSDSLWLDTSPREKASISCEHSPQPPLSSLLEQGRAVDVWPHCAHQPDLFLLSIGTHYLLGRQGAYDWLLHPTIPLVRLPDSRNLWMSLPFLFTITRELKSWKSQKVGPDLLSSIKEKRNIFKKWGKSAIGPGKS